MKFNFEPKEISRDDFLNLKEENIMFITNPGRMGDEDSSTFIIKEGDNYIPYRIDGLLYGNKTQEDPISLGEMLKHFPRWKKAWHNWKNEDYDGKYIYIYMGFGNGLSVDKRIYQEYEPYLLAEVKKVKKIHKEEKNNPFIYYLAWKSAAENMLNNK